MSTVQATPTPSTTSFAGGAGLTNTDQFYDGYSLTFTDGPNAGFSRSVLTYTGSTRLFTLSQPFPNAPAAGNHFNLSRLGAGQITGVWDDFGSNDLVNPANPPFDNIVSNNLSGGGGVQVQFVHHVTAMLLDRLDRALQ